MCGIAGFVSRGPWAQRSAPRVIAAMTGSIAHRGPDDQGVWLEAAGHVALGQRRLAIVDLSPGGHQPMVSADGRFVITFNGEIYNHGDLRAELAALGCAFRSASDTEVLLEAIARWGVASACGRARGMYAFAVWDRQTRRLSLARDRLGKKPLYAWNDGAGGVAFGSELRALWQFPGFSPELDPQALAEYFRYGYVSEHLSIFRGVEKVLPGTVLELGLGGSRQLHRYWSLAEVAERGASQRITDPREAEEQLLELLRDATRRRMLADVPLGAFLSGGVDSGLVVSLMQEASVAKVRTFSIGFRHGGFDEAPVARAVAQHLGTDHAELYVGEAEARNLVPALPEIFDEPFADPSQIPTHLLARLARPHVTVALTGDGGDESFGGYVRYRNMHGVVGALYGLPRPARQALAAGLRAVPPGVWETLVAAIPPRRRPRFIASKVTKLAQAMELDDPAERGKSYLSFWSPELLLAGSPSAADPFAPAGRLAHGGSEAMQLWESLHYLPGDLLAKMDRATMAVALEARAPLLDHLVVELAWRLPPEMKASRQAGKRILRSLLFRYLPRSLVDLPKQGFSAPIGRWLATGLRDWAQAQLDYGAANLAGLINWDLVEAAWRAHLAGRAGMAERLWIAVMFCAWHQRWLGTSDAIVPMERSASMA
jgi:asparagine synthase (glutamine-hydrolysing)